MGKLPEHQYLRLDQAIKLHLLNLDSKIILCGKFSFLYGKDRPPITEARKMREYLLEKGIDSKHILMEQFSKDTIGNAYYLKKYILKGRGYEKLIIITSRFHLERVKFIFNKFFNETKLEFVAVKDLESGEKEKEIIKRQEYLLIKTQDLLAKMKTGDGDFMKYRIYKTQFYKETRPDWVKQFVAKGK